MCDKNKLWAVMTARKWSDIRVGGMPLKPPPGGPCYFFPVFDTREAAVAWNGGSDERVAEMDVVGLEGPQSETGM